MFSESNNLDFWFILISVSSLFILFIANYFFKEHENLVYFNFVFVFEGMALSLVFGKYPWIISLPIFIVSVYYLSLNLKHNNSNSIESFIGNIPSKYLQFLDSHWLCFGLLVNFFLEMVYLVLQELSCILFVFYYYSIHIL